MHNFFGLQMHRVVLLAILSYFIFIFLGQVNLLMATIEFLLYTDSQENKATGDEEGKGE